MKFNQKNEQDHTFCTMDRALLLLHWPCLKPPQIPCGVPKLANLIEEMTWPGNGHSNDSVGSNFFTDLESAFHVSIGDGWDSDTWEHKLPICLVAKDICVGSPPISSKSTRVLPLVCNHERGTWYLWVQWYQNQIFLLANFSYEYSLQHLQCLRWLPTVLAAFACIIRSSVIARVGATTIWRDIHWPIASNALSIHPCLTLPHPCEV